MQTGDALHRGDDGHDIGRHVDQPAPFLCHLHRGEAREGARQVGAGAVQQGAGGDGVENPHRLEGRGFFHSPVAGDAPFLQEAAADAQAQVAPGRAQIGQEVEEEAEAVRRDVRDGGALRDGVAAIGALAEGEVRGGCRGFGQPFQRLGAQDRAQHLHLRQVEADIAAEEARPGAALQHHGIAGDAPLFRHHPGDAAALAVQAAHGAAGEDGGPPLPRRAGDGWGGALRLGAPVAGGVEGGRPAPGGAGQHRIDLRRAEHAAVELVELRVFQPGLVPGDVGRPFAEIDDAGLAVARVDAQAPVEAAPDALCLDAEGDLARVAAHGAAPAPVAAGLLAADAALLAERGGDALLRQGEHGADADDAAADHHDIDARRQAGIGFHGIDGWGHGVSASPGPGWRMAPGGRLRRHTEELEQQVPGHRKPVSGLGESWAAPLVPRWLGIPGSAPRPIGTGPGRNLPGPPLASGRVSTPGRASCRSA